MRNDKPSHQEFCEWTNTEFDLIGEWVDAALDDNKAEQPFPTMNDVRRRIELKNLKDTPLFREIIERENRAAKDEK